MNRDVLAVARKLLAGLAAARIDHVLGGALAFGYWGVARGTNDVDVTVFVALDEVPRVLDFLESLGARVDRERAVALAGNRGIFDVELDGIRVDVFIPDIPLYDSARARRRAVPFEGMQVMVWAPEDIALFKLLYFRTKDRADIETLIQVQRQSLDLGYIRHWLEELVGPEDERGRWFEEAVTRWL